MNARRGLTLIEVLLAVVLLAVLAATVVPYLGVRPRQPGVAEQSAFDSEVRLVLAWIERSHSEHPTLEEIRPDLQAIGAACSAAGEIDRVLQGQWVVIERGSEVVFYWVRVNETESSG